jgi:subtilisin family serine protease
LLKMASANNCTNRQRFFHGYWKNGPARRFVMGTLLIFLSAAAWAGAPVEPNRSLASRYVTLGGADLAQFGLIPSSRASPVKQQGRRIPSVTLFSKLSNRELASDVVPLPEADTLAGRNFFEGRFGRMETESGARLFNREIILVKFRDARHVGALRVEPLRELEALRAVRERSDVEFAELDSFERRQFNPDDPLLPSQWHHEVIGSFAAWGYSLGEPFVRMAIVDTPFQMDHPDLAAHTETGWDVVDGVPVTSASGIDHSTLCAGVAAAIIDNQIGVAGASNSRILPININGAISEMYDAVIWAADHGVRVVNISWTGADSDTLNLAGAYLKATARGVLAMSGVNGSGFLDYTNQPDIYCISMTDAADNLRSRFGNHIDFAAPGWEIFSTKSGSSYGYATGTSYSTPLFCGVVATLFSINPTLSPDEAIQLLKTTAVDFGSPGWDQFYGNGRINFAAAAAAADASRPVIASVQMNDGAATITVTNRSALSLVLWKTPAVGAAAWSIVTNSIVSTNAAVFTLTDPTPGMAKNFYRVEARLR